MPKLNDAGWKGDLIREQKTFTNGRIQVLENNCRRRQQKRADYILYYRRDFKIAVVEAKSAYKSAGDGLQQAKEYAKTLGVKFAYATNGKRIIEYDFYSGRETEVTRFSSPDELWIRFCIGEKIYDDIIKERLLAPSYRIPDKPTRYYQEIAINRVMKAILSGKKRILLTMATGTGKTFVAFQVVWKLWNAR